MISKENFDRLNNNFFDFTYTLNNILYSSGVFFYHTCTDEYFSEVFPLIQETLFWFGENVENIKLKVEEKLPSNADLKIFKHRYIISFSIFFEENSIIPNIQIAYGNDKGGTYLIVVIKDKQITSVELN